MSVQKQKNILLVEDEPLIALDEKMVLEDYGFQVIIENTGEKAVECVEKSPVIDLILMDINLGNGIDGTVAAQQILKRKDIPIVFLSSHTERDVVAKTEGITSYGYIVKNSGDMVLVASIKMAFRLYEAKQNVKKHAARNEAIINALPDLMFVIDKNGQYKEVHAPDKSLLPFPAQKLIGKKIFDVFDKDTAERFLKLFHECIKTGKTQVFEYSLSIQDNPHFFEANISRIDKKNILAIVHHITDRKQAKEKIENLNSLLISIRNVNQLIVQEDDLLKVMKESCDILQETRNYLNIEIALLNKSTKQFEPAANTGLHSLRQWTVTPGGHGTAPKCIKNVLITKKTLLVDNPREYCIQCSHYDEDVSHHSIIIPMFEKGNITGLLTTCLNPGYEFSSEEIGLLEEVAGDLGFARTKYETDKALKKSEAGLLAIFDSVDEPVYVANTETYDVIFTNKVLKERFGPLGHKKCYEYLQNRKAPCPFCTNDKILGEFSGKSYIWEFQNEINKRWYRCIDKAISWPDGRTVRYEMAVDITDLKKTEEALRISESNYADIFQTVSEGIAYTTFSGKVISVNPSLEKILNIPKDKLIDKNILSLSRELLSYQEIKRILPMLKQIIQGKTVQTFQVNYKDKCLELHTNINRQTRRLTGLVRDITQEKKAEEARRQSEFLFHSVWDHSKDGMRLTDKDGKTILINESFCRIVDMKKTELENKTLDIIYDPHEKKEVLAGYKNNYLYNTFHPYLERELTLWNGKSMWFGVSVSRIKIPDGDDLVLSAFRNITVRKIQQNIAHAVITASNLSEFYEVIRSELSKVMDTTNFLIAFYDKKTDTLSSPFEKDQKDNIPSWPAGKSLSGYVIRNNKPALLLKKDILNLASKGEIELIGSMSDVWLGVPLKKGKDSTGILVVQSYHNAHAYDNNCLEILETISSQLTIYIERKETEEALRDSEEKFRLLAEKVPGVIYLCNNDEHWSMLYLNDEVENLTGYPKNMFLDNTLSFADLYHPDDKESVYDTVEKAINMKEPFHLLYRIKHKDGSWRQIEEKGIGIYKNDRVEMIEGFLSDITAHKQAEEAIQKQLFEKETLLKEVHHRIKNNIGAIESLLSLKSKTIQNLEARSALQESIGRVRSMGVLYEKLLISGEFKDTSVKKYTENLIDTILELYPDREHISIHKNIDDFYLGTKKIFPLGIIINELLTNSMKYAFNEQQSCMLHVSLTKNARYAILSIQDNGRGFPEGFDFNQSKGFGLMLVKIMSEQLSGDLSVENKDGTHIVLKFEI